MTDLPSDLDPTRALPPALVAALVVALLSCACLGPAPALARGDAIVEVRSGGASELGVSTAYGVLFLGRNAQSGAVDLTAWFADGPSWEEGRVVPVGGGLYTTEAEIRLATVPISFEVPQRGTDVVVRGRRGSELWETQTSVTTHERVEGILLKLNGVLEDLADHQIGAGVFVGPEDDRRLVGLVSGRLLLETAEGRREYLSVLGPDDLWRAVLARKSDLTPVPRVYREDIL